MAWFFNKEVVNKIQISKEQLFNDNKSYNKTFRTNMIQKTHGTNCWPDNVKKTYQQKRMEYQTSIFCIPKKMSVLVNILYHILFSSIF